MKIQNSYIFLKNEYNDDSNQPKRDKDGNLVFELGRSVIGFINNCYPELKPETETDNFFKKTYSLSLETEKCNFNVVFHIHHVVDITYLDVCVEGKRREQIVECLEEIHSTVLNSGIRAHYIDIISYDAISEYYCNKIYVHLNTLERNLRKLFFNIYILNFGAHYYSETIDKALKDDLKSIIKQDTKTLKGQYRKEYNYRNNQEFDEIITIQRLFYSFDYSDMQKFLFSPTWSEYDKSKILKEHEDLSSCTDTELREIISNIAPQNNWNRFFSEKVRLNDIEEVFDSIRVYRNAVAHFKFFSKGDYVLCLKEVNKLNKAVIKAIKVTETEDFDKKNLDCIREMLVPTLEKFANVMNGIVQTAAESFRRFVQSDVFSNFQKICERLGKIAYDHLEEELPEDEDE